MKVCFINPPFKAKYGKFSRESRSPSIGHSGVLYYPLWLIYAACVAEKNGFEVVFIDGPAKRMTKRRALQIIEDKAADAKLFVFDTSTPSIYSDIAFASRVKRLYPDAITMLVGTHPSATPDETMNLSDNIDCLARHEYDYIVRDLAIAIRNGVSFETVDGLTWRKDNKIIHNKDAVHIEDLDDIPFASEFIKRHLCVKDYVFPAAAFPAIQIFTGRGCPARCNFCVYPQTLHGHKYRLRTPENVIEEIKYIKKNFPDVKEIVFEDDTFTINKKRVIEICDLIISNKIKIRWLCNARVNLDYETMCIMKKAGCHLIIPGIESVNQQILKNIHKGTTVEQIERYISDAKRAGLMVHACYMVGNEGETRETMEETLKAALRFNTDTAQFFPLIPYPGTDAYKWALENGYVNGRYDEYCQKDGTLNCIVSTPELSAKELVDFCSYARKKYYFRLWYIGHRIVKGLKDIEDLKRSLKAFKRLSKSLLK